MARIFFGAFCALLTVLSFHPAEAANHLTPPAELAPPDDTPRVVRFGCCDDTAIRDGSSHRSTQIGTLARDEQVWVTDMQGAGLPACLASPSTCGVVWAEAFFPDQGITGFVPLNALFVRPVIRARGRLQYEVGFRFLHENLADALDSALISPASCGDPSNIRTYTGGQVGGRDSVISRDQNGRQMCESVLAQPVPARLISCTHVDQNSAIWRDCIYQATSECNGLPPAGRTPSRSNSFCIRAEAGTQTTCLGCGEWYRETGQDSSGWKTTGELVDACIARYESNGVCNVPGQGAGGGGGGGGGSVDVPTAGDGFAHSIDDDDFDPGDPNPAPEPDVAENALGLTATGGTSQAQSSCVNACFEHVRAYNVSACRNFIGGRDTKRAADHADYACGEYPVGTTHPNYFANLDTGDMSGDPDQSWKWLSVVRIQQLKNWLIIRMGRLQSQTAASIRVNDHSRRVDNRRIEIGPGIRQNSFWVRISPRTVANRDVMNIDFCTYLPGVSIRSDRVNVGDDSKLRHLIKSIDLGGVDIASMSICQGYNFSVRDNYRLQAQATDDRSAEVIIVPGSLRGVDIRYSNLVNVATVAAPIGRLIILSLQIGTVLAETAINSTEASILAQLVLLESNERISNEILRTLDPMMQTAMDDLNETVDIPKLLGSVCGALAPRVGRNNQTFYFNQFLRWQCDGFAADPNLRGFIPHEPSADLDCYAADKFIKPADARRDWWWTPYSGQSWAFNLTAGTDRGCRMAGEMRSTLDRDTWPTLICAMTIYNSWLNGASFPDTGVLNQQIQNNCAGFVRQALNGYYGNGNDLAELWVTVNTPTTHGIGGLTSE